MSGSRGKWSRIPWDPQSILREPMRYLIMHFVNWQLATSIICCIQPAQISSDYYLKSMLHKICSWHRVIKKCTKHRILESFVTDLHQYHQVHKYLFVREISLRETANITWHVQPAGHGDFHVTALHYADLLLASNRDHAAVLYKNTILLRWMNPCRCCTDKQCTRYCLCAVTY